MSLHILSTLKEICKLLAVTGILPTAALPPFVFRFRETELTQNIIILHTFPQSQTVTVVGNISGHNKY